MLRTETMRMFDAADEIVKGMINASNISILEAVANTDDELVGMIVPMCKLYAGYKAHALETAKMMDEMKEEIDLLVKQNKTLLVQVERLQDKI